MSRGPSCSGAPERISWSGNPICDPSVTSYVFVFLFLSRGERSEGGAESFSLEAPGRSQLYSEVQFFCHSEHCALVPAESWGQPHHAVFHDFRDEAERKAEFYSEF